MPELSNILTPLAGEIGVGGIGGFLAGWALKKAAKMVAVLIGVAFLGLQYLAYRDIISIDYGALQSWVNELVGQASGTQSLLIDFIAHAPFGAAFVGGFYLGLQKG
ncbi:MAG: FUN14 domain-containing protein [Candidatus Bathyarchaeota archaeon]|nr:MAG: FUN14 domain-containing protein [Candidatus Bathyarchaeota archaeon]